MSSRPSLRTIALSLTTLLVPLSMITGAATSAFYKSNNPDNVDITNSLAYLQQSLIASFGVGVLITALIIWLIIRMYKRDGNFTEAKLPLTLLIVIVVAIITLGLVSNYTSSVEDQYRIDNGQPTIDEFFNKLDQQNQQ